jgi:hypothetical protein
MPRNPHGRKKRSGKGCGPLVKHVPIETKRKIFTLIALGESISKIAAHMGVSTTTVYYWISKDKELKSMVKEAKQLRAHGLIDEMIDIADDDSEDIIEDEDGKKIQNHINLGRAKLKIQTREKVAKLYNPADYAQSSPEVHGNVAMIGLTITPPKQVEPSKKQITQDDVIDVTEE